MEAQLRELQAQILAFKSVIRGAPIAPEAAKAFRGVPFPPRSGYVPSTTVATLHARVRKQVASEMLIMTSMAAATDVNAYKRPMVYDVEGPEEAAAKTAQQAKVRVGPRSFNETVLKHYENFKAYHNYRKALVPRLLHEVKHWLAQQEIRKKRAAEDAARNRLKALKSNDEEAYMRLLKEATNERVQALLNQTEDFLAKMGALVQTEKNQAAALDLLDGKDGEQQPSTSNAEDNTPKADWVRWIESKNKYYAGVHKIREEIKEQPSLLKGGDLKPYQMIGLQWMTSLFNNNINGILADEMGLGKTIQTIALIAHLMESKKVGGPYLIIVPLSTMDNWRGEFEKWAPTIKVITYRGPKLQRHSVAATLTQSNRFNVLITTYEYIMRDKNYLARPKWQYIIIDEGHRMKNMASKLHIVLSKHFSARHRLLLTGTPLQNNLRELWSLLNFLLPTVFKSMDDFENWFNAPFAQMGEKVELSEEEQLLIIHRLHQVLRPFLLRRVKSEVLDQLPEKREMDVKCDLSAFQRVVYKQIQEGALSSFKQAGVIKSGGLQNSIMQLRKICQHPYLFFPPETTTDEIVRSSGKFELLDRMLPKLFAGNHKVLIFSQFTQVLDILEDYFEFKGQSYLRLDGSTKSEERGQMMEQFKAKESDIMVFLLSTRAGGLGLNLQSADTVILFDSDWNPHMDMQAQARAHRIGQVNQVLVFRLTTISGVEQYMLDKASHKLDVDAKVIQAGKFNEISSEAERHDLLEQLLQKDDDDLEGRDELPDDKTINKMLARLPGELELFEKMDVERHGRELAQWKETHGDQPLQSRLMQEHEIPPFLKQHIRQRQEEKNAVPVEMGKGKRARNTVRYDQDLMTESQFLKFVDEGGEMEDYMKARKRKARVYLPIEELAEDAPTWKKLIMKRRIRWRDEDLAAEDAENEEDEDEENEDSVMGEGETNNEDAEAHDSSEEDNQDNSQPADADMPLPMYEPSPLIRKQASRGGRGGRGRGRPRKVPIAVAAPSPAMSEATDESSRRTPVLGRRRRGEDSVTPSADAEEKSNLKIRIVRDGQGAAHMATPKITVRRTKVAFEEPLVEDDEEDEEDVEITSKRRKSPSSDDSDESEGEGSSDSENEGIVHDSDGDEEKANQDYTSDQENEGSNNSSSSSGEDDEKSQASADESDGDDPMES